MDFLRSDRIILSKFTKDNITEEYLGWLNDPQVNRYLCTGRFPVVREDIGFYTGEKNFLFSVNVDNTYIGTISLHNIDWIVRKGEVGYMLGNKNYWGKGVATEIVQLVTNYGFNRLNLNKLYAGVVDGNVGSSKALLKNGYKEYARVPQEYYLNGKLLDTTMYYKLQEWV